MWRWCGRELCYIKQMSKFRMRPRFLTTEESTVKSHYFQNERLKRTLQYCFEIESISMNSFILIYIQDKYRNSTDMCMYFLAMSAKRA